ELTVALAHRAHAVAAARLAGAAAAVGGAVGAAEARFAEARLRRQVTVPVAVARQVVVRRHGARLRRVAVGALEVHVALALAAAAHAVLVALVRPAADAAVVAA